MENDWTGQQQVFEPLEREDELDRLAERMRAANSAGMQLMNFIGSRAEGLLDMLPAPAKSGLEQATALVA